MKKSELDTLRSFAAHVEKVMKAMPCLDGSRYSTRVVNAWRLAKKELARVTKIIENVKTANDNEHETDNTAAG